MPMPSIRLRAARPLAAFVASSLAACAAPLQPVADFGGAANELATRYRPFVADVGASCEQRLRYKALGDAGAFDDASARRASELECAPLRKEAETANLFARALSDYATALARLAHTKPTVFDGELRDVSGAVKKLEASDGTPLFDTGKVNAATRLARAAAAMLTLEKERTLARATLEDNQDALATVVGAMKTYAVAIYGGQLRDTRAVMAGELGRLVAASYAPTQADVEAKLPWRFAQSVARADLAANELQSRRVNAFVAGADALLAAHAALIENFDRLGGAQRLALVADFVAKVQAMADDVSTL